MLNPISTVSAYRLGMIGALAKLESGQALRLLLRGEALALAVIAMIAGLDVVLALLRGVVIDVPGFARHTMVAGILSAVAIFYRRRGRSPQIALALMACAILILFTNAGAVLNYLLIPAGRDTIDPLLTEADRMLGFDWPAFAAAIASWPLAAKLLSLVYMSSLGQMAISILVLGFTGRQVALHRFLACGMIASLVSMVVWSLAPSIGPAAWAQIDPETSARLGRVLGAEFAAQMQDLLLNGPQSIEPEKLLGLIAFPSMHTVMMCMAAWYMRGTRLFPLFAALVVPMVPAILVHGSHNLVDVFGGLVVFAGSAFAASRIIPQDTDTMQDRTAAFVAPPAMAPAQIGN